jgi:hypothetical protein
LLNPQPEEHRWGILGVSPEYENEGNFLGYRKHNVEVILVKLGAKPPR